jgi:Tfp pilus assembly protein PilO
MPQMKLDNKFGMFLLFYIGFVVLALIIPVQVGNIFSVNAKTAELKGKIEKFQQGMKQQDQLSQEKLKISEEITEMENRVATSQDVSAITAYISSQAKENSVEIIEVTPQPIVSYKKTADGQFSKLPLKIEARASYHSLGKFLNRLETGGYFIEAKAMIIKAGQPVNEVSLILNALIKG